VIVALSPETSHRNEDVWIRARRAKGAWPPFAPANLPRVTAPRPRARVTCASNEVRVGPGQKGEQVTEILSVDTSTALQEPARRARPKPRHASPEQAAVEELGTVKFYAAEKGFGFIVRDLGGKDIFVHASALNRAGISELAEGQRVAVDVVEGGKGPEAVSIRLI
jgi:cold shock CspA family protein